MNEWQKKRWGLRPEELKVEVEARHALISEGRALRERLVPNFALVTDGRLRRPQHNAGPLDGQDGIRCAFSFMRRGNAMMAVQKD
jgi:hypothetical protein